MPPAFVRTIREEIFYPPTQRTAALTLNECEEDSATEPRAYEIMLRRIPPNGLETLQPLPCGLHEYAKLISRSAYGSPQREFITDRSKKLQDEGIGPWS